MPNHIKNRVSGPASVLDKLVGEEDGKPCVDFSKVVPQPKAIVKDSIGSHIKSAAEIALGLIDFRTTGDPAALFKSGNYGRAGSILHVSNCTRQLLEGPHPKDFNDKEWALFMQCLTAYRECSGLMDWYDWNIANWGTKWNAYRYNRPNENQLEFETAWSAPHRVLEALSKAVIEPFSHEWADEDTGSNVGCREYKGFGVFETFDMSNTREGYELAFALGHADPTNYELVGNTYQFREEEEPTP